ncbi:sigma-70 family RNA polymerase sigma factor [Kibdelosporangium philippinense]|uniref:RNA polymerase sigma factor n=1 Tax=Kibdelosporangium philippinense TaxID=211113 RepID=A0ABS8Z7C5_9PSEU|nr:sigma-70 family RNA polymerase sigma factor [Kibdelosporangium philippinense]MCE7003786.1 sigma-70 family RNA polymerase sigma factor [Kibdelosporangium philippinense]
MTDAHRAVDAVWKLEAAKIIGGLTRMVHDVGLAEELAQDALVAALEQWPESGVPANPGAWLMAIAKRRAIDHIRRAKLAQSKQAQGKQADLVGEDDEPPQDDDVLRLMFITCDPILPAGDRAALTLRLLGGLSPAEIARALLTSEQNITQRIAKAKRTLAAKPRTKAAEIPAVLEVTYLIFNEGYSATSGDDLMRPGLCLEALRLGRMLTTLAPREAEVHGLVALMEIQASRQAARTGPRGEPIPLPEQDRGRWDPLLIRRGFTAMLRARDIGGTPGPYVLQAAIAVCHAQAKSAQDTEWVQICNLYTALVRLVPTPVVQLNRAVAFGKAYGPEAGLAMVDRLLDDPTLRDYHFLPSVRGDLLEQLGRCFDARLEYERAASLTKNAAERAFLLRRAESIVLEVVGPTLGEATVEFLSRTDLDAATLRSYGQTLHRLCRTLGEQLPIASLNSDQVVRFFVTVWGKAAPKTWNRHRSAIRTFGAWAGLSGLDAGLERRTEPPARARNLQPARLDMVWRLDAGIRERTLWRLLHESGAAVTTVLSLNVEDIEFSQRRARAGRTWVTWRSATAKLLPELLAGRTRGPVFLAERKSVPARMPSAADLCPETGRGRLSYPRAEYLFKQATRPLDPSGDGYTLKQLKPGNRARSGASPR